MEKKMEKVIIVIILLLLLSFIIFALSRGSIHEIKNFKTEDMLNISAVVAETPHGGELVEFAVPGLSYKEALEMIDSTGKYTIQTTRFGLCVEIANIEASFNRSFCN